MKIKDTLNNSKILIWGYGREGKSSEAFIKQYCENVQYDIYEGDKQGFNEDDYDLIIKSPGIPYLTNNPKYTSQTKLFLNEFSSRTIAITGSKGKSTTSSLLYKVLLDAGLKCILVGNIGNPCLDYYNQIEDDTYIVFEISAHQLSNIDKSAHIGAFLNIYEEHLDYYKTMANYFNAKANLAIHQTKDDYILIGNNIPDIKTESNVIRINNDKHFEMKLLGEHNQYNANFVYYIAHNLLNIDENIILNTFKNFTNLKHRLDYIGNINDIDYYDDSISTIPEATINAIEAIKNVQTILIGGMDRGIDYNKLIDFINNDNEHIFIMMYASGKRIYESLNKKENIHLVKDLYEAVDLAKSITDKNKACLLSPAAASYDSFKNFEQRGDIFKELINKS